MFKAAGAGAGRTADGANAARGGAGVAARCSAAIMRARAQERLYSRNAAKMRVLMQPGVARCSSKVQRRHASAGRRSSYKATTQPC